MELQYADEELIKLLPNFTNNYADVNGTKLHYVAGGQGPPLVLVPGYPETSWTYHQVMPILSRKISCYCGRNAGNGKFRQTN